MNSVYEFATITVKAEAIDEFRSGIARGGEIIASQPGCSSVDIWQCVEEPTEFVLRAAWADVESHNAFRDSEDFPLYRETVQDTFAEKPRYKHFVEILAV